MKRQVLITTTLLLSLSGGLASESIASSLLLTNAPLTDLQTLLEESATPSLLKSGADLKQNAERDRQRQQEAARREQERQRQAEMQERWQEDRDDDDDDDRRRDRWEDSEDYWENRDSQQDRDRERWEDERGDRDWEQQQNSRYWEEQRRTWENQQRSWEQQRDWEFRREWWRNNGQQNRYDWQSQNPTVDSVSNSGTRLDLTSLSDDWVTVLIESVDGEQALSFTGSNSQQAVYLAPGAYRLRFRPTLSSQPWRSGYLNVEETDSIRLVFDQDRDLVQVYDSPSAWATD